MRTLALVIAAALAVPSLTALADDSSNGSVNTIPVKDDDKDKSSDDHAHHSESVTYSGIGLTRVTTDFDNLKSAVNLNFVLGFRVPTFDIFGAEVEIGTTVIPGERKDIPQCSSGGGPLGGVTTQNCPGKYTQSQSDLQMNNIGVFGVLRSPGRFYAMGKYGYRYLNTSIDELSQNRSGAAWGLGGGYRWGESLSGVELFYTHFSQDVKYMGFSIAYGFGGSHERD
jgi:hypothetical protein